MCQFFNWVEAAFYDGSDPVLKESLRERVYEIPEIPPALVRETWGTGSEAEQAQSAMMDLMPGGSE